MKVRIFYQPVRSVEVLEGEVNEFLERYTHLVTELDGTPKNGSYVDVVFTSSNHGVYAMIKYS